MQAEDLKDQDTESALTSACLGTCKSAGRAYTLNVIADLTLRMQECRDPAGKLSLMRLLAKVEALVEQMELPIDRRTQP
jgi:hypothetical protein